MLRTTTEGMSAIIGGIDALTIKPFDYSYKEQNNFSDRIAKNQQLVLKEEAHFDKVIDPAAGSYYIENITEALIDEAWKLFIEVEDKGGYVRAFKEGFIQKKIKTTANKRNIDIALKKKVFLGTNQYPNQNENIINDIDKEKAFQKKEKIGKTAEPLTMYRGAQSFELLRLNTEQLEQKPKVFLLTYGNLNMRKARASFASNFFACAGYEIIDNFGFETIEEGIKEAKENNADIVVLCSSDDEYKDIVSTTMKSFNDKTEVVLAGYPKEQIKEYQELGLKTFIHIKSNIIETLIDFHKKFNIKTD